MSTVERKLNATDVKYGIICAGSSFEVPLDISVTVKMDGRSYEAKMNSKTKGRIDGLTELYRDNNLCEGDVLELFYHCMSDTIFIEKKNSEGNVEENEGVRQEEGFDVNAFEKKAEGLQKEVWADQEAETIDFSVEFKKKEKVKENLPVYNDPKYIENLIQIPFVSGKKINIKKEKYKYKGQELERFIFSCDSVEIGKISSDLICSAKIDLEGFLIGDSIWLYYIILQNSYLLRMAVGGKKIQERYTFNAGKDSVWQKLVNIYEMSDGLLLELANQRDKTKYLQLFRKGDKSFKILIDGNFKKSWDNNNLAGIFGPEGKLEDKDTLFLFGEKGISDIGINGKILPWELWIRNDILGYLKKSIVDCLKLNAPEELVRVDYFNNDIEGYCDPIEYIRLDYDFERRSYHITMMPKNEGIVGIIGGKNSKKTPPSWTLWLSEDGQKLQDEDYNEIDIYKYGSFCSETEEPGFVQMILDYLYCILSLRAIKLGDISAKPSMENLRKRLITWYDSDSGVKKPAIAIFNSYDDTYEYYILKNGPRVVFIRLGEDFLSDCAIEVSKDLYFSKISTLFAPGKYEKLVQTDELLIKIEALLSPLEDILNSYKQKEYYDKGDANYDSKSIVSYKNLIPLIYAIRSYEPFKSIYFWIDLEEYGLPKAAYLKIDLAERAVYINRDNSLIPFEKANLPDLMMFEEVMPHSEKEIGGRDPLFRAVNRNGHKEWRNNRFEVRRVVSSEAPDYSEKNIEPLEKLIYDDISIECKTPDGKWITHPYLRNMRAYGFLPLGITYVTAEGMYCLLYTGQNVKINDVNNVLKIQKINDDLKIMVFESFGYSREETFLWMDMYDVTVEITQINHNMFSIPLKEVFKE